jgi:hypothetical protein
VAEKSALAQARTLYKKKDREAIARYHGITVDHPVLEVMLAFCVKYDLDPLGGHVWLVDNDFDRTAERAKDGEPVDSGTELSVGVTRDGLLSIALRDASYEGMENDAVRLRDTFKVKRERGEAVITHEYPDLPKQDGEGEQGKAEDYRGEIIGAYAQVFVKGRKPQYYFAWMSEHGQFREEEGGKRIFEGAWKYTSALMIKCAQSVALRWALGITGVVGLDEVRPDPKAPPADPPGERFGSPEEFIADLELPEDLTEELTGKVMAANQSAPNSWSLAKLRMRLSASNPEDLEEAARRVIQEADRELQRRAGKDDVPGSGGESPAKEPVPAPDAAA